MITDPISDMLTRIRNAALVKKAEVILPSSKIKFSIAKILEKEGYLANVRQTDKGPQRTMTLQLKYENGQSVVHKIRRVSTPGRRVYSAASELPRVLSGFGIAVISTPNGLMTNREARKRKLGGEVICEVY
ncbi:MAG: 30S ribosomal protein S8 [Patescibacteria group bacterium]